MTTTTYGGNNIQDNLADITIKGLEIGGTEYPYKVNNVIQGGTGTFTIIPDQVIEFKFGESRDFRAYAKNRIGTGYGNFLTYKKPCVLPPTKLTAVASDYKSITATVNFYNDNNVNIYDEYNNCTTNHKVKIDIVASYNESLVFETVTLSASRAGVSYTFNNLNVCTFYAIKASHYSDQVPIPQNIIGDILKTRDRNVIFSGPQGSFINSNTYQVSGSVSGDLIPQSFGSNLIVATIFSSINPDLNINSYEYLLTGTNMTINDSRFKRGQKNYVRFMVYTDYCQDNWYNNNKSETQHYSSVHEFIPPLLAIIPTVTTNDIINKTGNSGTSGGNVTSDGGGTVTERGVVYSSTNNQPTISNSKTSNGSGTGSFTSIISDLIPSTTYYVRAYATNSAGTGYGVVKVLKTCSFAYAGNKVLTKLAGKIIVEINGIYDNGEEITDRGVILSTNTTITVENFASIVTSYKQIQRPSSNGTTGDYSITFDGLLPGRYYTYSFIQTCAGYSYNRVVGEGIVI